LGVNYDSDDSNEITILTNKFNNIETIKKEWIMKERKKNRDSWVDKRIKYIIDDAKNRYKQEQKKRRKFK